MALSRTATLLLKLGEKSYGTAVGLIGRLDDSQRRKVARMLIQRGFAWIVAHSIDHFPGMDDIIAADLIRARQDLGGIVARNAARFGWNTGRIADELSANGQAWALPLLPPS